MQDVNDDVGSLHLPLFAFCRAIWLNQPVRRRASLIGDFGKDASN
jgi:hypothetical protein